MGKLFVVNETKQRSGLYSLFHLPDLNVPFDLASKTKWALLVSAHDASISPFMLLLEYFQVTWWLLKSPMTIVGWEMFPRTQSGHIIVGGLYTLIIVVCPTLTLTIWMSCRVNEEVDDGGSTHPHLCKIVQDCARLCKICARFKHESVQDRGWASML
ncbi:Hypothetical protein CINCED_3A020190 [Cinara cedri]|uniref:Uncharacterized protein n=1 Tax=Cinara cedri TaxID=506608 RepID=A0A5E4NBT5_9HEMI|nr:Hypothetical protein CINCED_3A020190 [Cinara cedri]